MDVYTVAVYYSTFDQIKAGELEPYVSYVKVAADYDDDATYMAVSAVLSLEEGRTGISFKPTRTEILDVVL